jgi:hypothetical protein
MFLWKYVDIDPTEVSKIQKAYYQLMPDNDHFFQTLDLGVDKFLGMDVQRFVLIQVAPHALGRIHTDFRPKGYGDQLALQIPLDNCEDSITELWESSYDPPVQYTSNGQPYRYFDPARCKKLTEFTVTQPLVFRTDVPHSVSNPKDTIRRAISIRFKNDPWHLVGGKDE